MLFELNKNWIKHKVKQRLYDLHVAYVHTHAAA